MNSPTQTNPEIPPETPAESMEAQFIGELLREQDVPDDHHDHLDHLAEICHFLPF